MVIAYSIVELPLAKLYPLVQREGTPAAKSLWVKNLPLDMLGYTLKFSALLWYDDDPVMVVIAFQYVKYRSSGDLERLRNGQCRSYWAQV